MCGFCVILGSTRVVAVAFHETGSIYKHRSQNERVSPVSAPSHRFCSVFLCDAQNRPRVYVKSALCLLCVQTTSSLRIFTSARRWRSNFPNYIIGDTIGTARLFVRLDCKLFPYINTKSSWMNFSSIESSWIYYLILLHKTFYLHWFVSWCIIDSVNVRWMFYTVFCKSWNPPPRVYLAPPQFVQKLYKNWKTHCFL